MPLPREPCSNPDFKFRVKVMIKDDDKKFLIERFYTVKPPHKSIVKRVSTFVAFKLFGKKPKPQPKPLFRRVRFNPVAEYQYIVKNVPLNIDVGKLIAETLRNQFDGVCDYFPDMDESMEYPDEGVCDETIREADKMAQEAVDRFIETNERYEAQRKVVGDKVFWLM